MAPRKAANNVQPSGKQKMPTPPVMFEEKEESERSSRLIRSQKTTSKTAKRRSFSDLLTYLFIRFLGIYFVIGALFTCSTHPFSFDYSTKDSNSICRNLAHGKNHIVPVLAPLFHSAQQRIDPYTDPYIKAVKPYTQAIYKAAKPYYNRAQKQGKVVYNKHVEPMRKTAIKRGRSYSDPHVKKFNKQYQKQVQPHVDNLNKAVKPYQDIYDRDVAPYVSQAYSQSLAVGSASYSFYVDRVHPHVVKSLQQLHSFYTYHFDPAVRRAYSLYVRPQVEKLMAKLFERKAHATSSEAISEAKQEVKQAEKEGKARSHQAQEEAITEATRKKDDPSLVEKAQQATESFLGMASDADEIEMARLDAELEAEGESAKEQLEAWEEGLSNLMSKEYKLFTERIADLRNRRLADLPDHFDSLTETSVEDEVAAVLARLERMYKKLGKSELSISEQVTKANEQYDTQKAKLEKAEQALQGQILEYQQSLLNDEVKSLDASVGEIRRFVVEAGRSYSGIMDEAKFEKTVDDFEGWESKLIEQANFIEQEMRNLLQGSKIRSGFNAVDLRKEPKLDSHIADLQSRVKKLYSTANSQVNSYVTKGNMQLRGEGALGAISDATDAVATQARLLSDDAAALMLESALAARKKVGLGPKENAGILERVQKKLHQATQSVSSVVGAATPTASSAGEYIEDYASSASSLAASVVGYKTEPDSYVDIVGDSASSVFDVASSTALDVSKSVASAYDAAASNVGDAFTAATTSAGNVYNAASSSVVNVVPTSIAGQESVRSIVDVAQDQFDSIAHSASSIAEAVVASGSSLAGAAVETTTPESGSVQGVIDSVQRAVKSAGEVIEKGSEAVVNGDDSKLVGKQPEDKDFNTMGKAADALKEKIVHAEL